MPIIPSDIPASDTDGTPTPVGPTLPTNPGQYDFLLNGVGWHLAVASDNTGLGGPITIQDAQIRSQSFQQSNEPGDNSLTDWWRSSQSSFHGGAGQDWLEPTVPSQYAKARYDTSFNVWPFDQGRVTRLPDVSGTAALPDTGRVRMTVCQDDSGNDGIVVVAQENASKPASFTTGSPDPTYIEETAKVGSATKITGLASNGVRFYVAHVYSKSGTPTAAVWRSLFPTSIDGSDYGIMYETDPAAGDITLAWVKGRMMAAQGRNVYELDANATTYSTTDSGIPALPSPVFTHQASDWVVSSFTESPLGILVAGSTGSVSDCIELQLDLSTSVPTLQGGAQAFTMPPGETIQCMATHAGSFLVLGTSKGVRVGTWDGYTSKVTIGPLTVETPNPVYDLAGFGNYVVATGTGVQDAGESGLLAISLGSVVDDAGRYAWAPHMPCPSANTGTVWATVVLNSGRFVYAVDDKAFITAIAPGTSREAWIRTSRVRMNTTEPKLFKSAQLRGTVSAAEISADAIYPAGDGEDASLVATFTNITGDPDPFNLPNGTREWIALRFHLGGSGCELNSYQVSALPAPKRQWRTELTAWCENRERNRRGQESVHPIRPRDRWRGVQELLDSGSEVSFIEYDERGPVTSRVVVESAQFRQVSPAKQQQAFGGTVTFLLRTTEGAS